MLEQSCGQIGTTFHALTNGGIRVVLKISTAVTMSNLHHEARVYERLRQSGNLGTVSPWFIGLYRARSPLSADHKGMTPLVLVMEDAGSGLDSSYITWTQMTAHEQ